MKVLPLTVLAYEGPGVRAYLASMRRAGLKPRRVLLMVLSRHPATGRPVGRWLPRRLRMWYAEKGQKYVQNYWPRRIKASHPYLVDAIAGEMARFVDDPAGLIDEMLGPFRYEDYAEKVERVLVAGLRDEALAEALVKTGPGAVLFTGGGILPARLINLPGLRFLHIHPGYLPHARGADALLWSMLVRGRPAVSCFYMGCGIDTGRIIAAEDYPPVQFDITGHPRPDDRTLYRAIFSFCDPILRAQFLIRKVLTAGADLCSLPAAEQDPSRGVTYHFMHPLLRGRVLPSLFAGPVGSAACPSPA